MRQWKWVAHHDDGCEGRLTNYICNECGISPDMQSISLHYYCPDCDIPLTPMKLRKLPCPKCKEVFAYPE